MKNIRETKEHLRKPPRVVGKLGNPGQPKKNLGKPRTAEENLINNKKIGKPRKHLGKHRCLAVGL